MEKEMNLHERDCEMMELRKAGETLESIGKKFGISSTQVRVRVSLMEREISQGLDPKFEIKRMFNEAIYNRFRSIGVTRIEQLRDLLASNSYDFSSIPYYGKKSHNLVCSKLGIYSPFKKTAKKPLYKCSNCGHCE